MKTPSKKVAVSIRPCLRTHAAMRRKTHVSQVVLPDLSRLHVSRPVGMDAPPDAKRQAMQDEPPSDQQPLQLPEDLLLKVFTMVLEDSETDPAPADPAPAESGSVSADRSKSATGCARM